MVWLVRGRILSEDRNPLNRAVLSVYRPLLGLVMRHRVAPAVVAVLVLCTVAWPASRIGSEFMPPLDEGDLLYMPSTLPGLSITKAREVLQQTDRIIKGFPEVERVFGKVGRAETATDNAPLSMIETVVTLAPRDRWRPGMTTKKLVAELDRATSLPGLTNVWTMPIKTRIDMLSTGIKTPVGVKLAGPDLRVLEKLGREVETALRDLPGTQSVFAERVVGGNYLDVDIDREQIARYGLTVGDVQDVIGSAIGGMNVTETVEGLERYPVNLRYPRELRDDVTSLRRVLVATPGGAHVPLGQLATLEFRKGPAAIRTENSRPSAWVYVDLEGVDVGTYVARAKEVVARELSLPTGYTLAWSGQYEYLERATRRMETIVPLTLALIVLLLYVSSRSVSDTLLVIACLPLAWVGGVYLVWLLDYDFSVAVLAGFLALSGLTAETGVVMLLFLNQAVDRAREGGRLTSIADLRRATLEGATDRVRPLLMTVGSDVIGLLPIMWGLGTGSETMKRVAAPMVGGIVTATTVILLVLPVFFVLARSRRLPRPAADAGA
jgi:Cu(I)/Ag(I) efflux system membrane protein CusA/SilA